MSIPICGKSSPSYLLNKLTNKTLEKTKYMENFKLIIVASLIHDCTLFTGNYSMQEFCKVIYVLKWQYDQIFSLRFFCSNNSYSPNITYCASKNEFSKHFLKETGPLQGAFSQFAIEFMEPAIFR